MKKYLSTLRQDLPAGIVVFLVALPLCLGVGLASTTVEGIDGLPNTYSGIIAGIVGGIVVGIFSKSKIGVSGPAAGLITIVLAAIATLGSFESLLLAIVFSGILQVIAGFLKLGILGNYFPSSVIKGMLAAIGITLILKEIPHAMGYDKDFFGDEAFFQFDGHNTFSELLYATNSLHLGSGIIAAVSLGILILFERPFMKKIAFFKIFPAALFVVVTGISLNLIFQGMNDELMISAKHLVQLPIAGNLKEAVSFFSFPDFTQITNPDIYLIGATIALVGSLESLLSVDATDKLDPDKFTTPTNRELKAQGLGNIVSGLIGGLPVTQVIVRSSANVGAGAKSKLSTILHGFFLLIAVLFIPSVLNLIPLASLAAILIMVGYKLSKVQLYRQLYRLGLDQFLPFIATIVGIMFTDLLKGIGIGMAVSFFFIIRKNYRNNYRLVIKEIDDTKEIKMTLSEEVSFLNKGSISELFEKLPRNSKVTIDGSRCTEIDHDVLEIIQEFKSFGSKEKQIQLTTINIPEITISGQH